MGFGDIFKRSRRQVNRENQEQGKRGERQIREKYELHGKKVERTGKGHDFKVTTTDWLTGKKKTEYVEVKTGNSKVSPLQKKKMKQLGDKYVVERVGSGPFGIGSSTTRGTPKKSSSGIWGSGSLWGSPKKKTATKKKRATKKKSTSKKSSSSIWGSSLDSAPKKRKTSRKSSSSSIWGSGSSSMWGSKKKRRKSGNKSDFWM